MFLRVLLVAATILLPQSLPQVPSDDAVRIHEFYRLAQQIQDELWPNWSKVPSPLMLVTPEGEFLTYHPSPPRDFKDVGSGFYFRQRQFPTSLLATFPAFGPPSVIVIGQPKNTDAKTSTPWLLVVMHEHFHQLQNAQPGYFQALAALGLARGDNTGMWMLNYPFPYDQPEVASSFSRLRDLLLAAVNQADEKKFKKLARRYIDARGKFFAQLAPDDRKYLEFQLWQEGIARYTQIKSAEAAVHYQPTPEYAALSDYESFTAYAAHARTDTLNELKRTVLPEWKRTVVYSFGAAEAMLLDRIHPNWKENYFKHPLSMEPFFNK
jgi:hypothetical protein